MKGHAIAEFVLVFPFFILLLSGMGDLILLSIAQISLERSCMEAVQVYAAQGVLPKEKIGKASMALHDLPSIPSVHALRARRKFELVQLELSRKIPLRFPLLRIVFGNASLPVNARCVALRVSYEK